MPNVRVISTGVSSLTVDIENLSYPQNQYDAFRVWVDDPNLSDTSKTNIPIDSTYTGLDTQNVTITTGSSNCTHTVYGEAKWKGTWYSVTNASGTTDKQPAPTLTVAESGSDSIYVDWSDVLGTTKYEIDYKQSTSSSWSTITHYDESTTNRTITGLSPDTSYDFKVRGYVSGNCSTYWTDFSTTQSATTDVVITPPGDPTLDTSLGDNGRGDGSLYVQWTAPTTGTVDYYVLEYSNYGGTWTTNSTDASETLTNLEYGVSYGLRVKAVATDGTHSDWSGSNTATTLPKTPAISAGTNNSDTTLTVYSSVSEGNWSYINVACYNNETNTFIETKQIYPSDPDSYVQFFNLDPGTEYRFVARSYFEINNTTLGSYTQSPELFMTTHGGPRPADWVWNIAHPTDGWVTDTNGDIITGRPFWMPATHWNDFTTRINGFRSYMNLSTYTFTNVSTGDTFAATIFNEAIAAIDAMITTGVTYKDTNSPIRAGDFNTLKDKMNTL